MPLFTLFLIRHYLVLNLPTSKMVLSDGAPMDVAPVQFVVDNLEEGLEPTPQRLLHEREPRALPTEWTFSSWRVFMAYLHDGRRTMMEVLWVSGVGGEDLLNGPVYLDALLDAYHVGSPRSPANLR